MTDPKFGSFGSGHGAVYGIILMPVIIEYNYSEQLTVQNITYYRYNRDMINVHIHTCIHVYCLSRIILNFLVEHIHQL